MNDITGGRTRPPSSRHRLRGHQGPRFNFEVRRKRPSDHQMKSVGEVMAIGRNFQESCKALRGLETGQDRLTPWWTSMPRTPDPHSPRAGDAGAERIFYDRRRLPCRSLHGRRVQADRRSTLVPGAD